MGEDGGEEAAGERRGTGGICLCMMEDGGDGGSALTRGFGLEDKKHRQPSKNIYYLVLLALNRYNMLKKNNW